MKTGRTACILLCQARAIKRKETRRRVPAVLLVATASPPVAYVKFFDQLFFYATRVAVAVGC
jgi:hypothetical protein